MVTARGPGHPLCLHFTVSLSRNSHYSLVYIIIYICTCIYKMVNLVKSYDNLHGMAYRIKIMLSGIAILNTGYFNNTND